MKKAISNWNRFFNASELFKQIQKLKKHELISLIKR
jgi:hypothetical protein